MFLDHLNALGANDIRGLASAGIAPSRISEWRKGRRIPTRSQALAFALHRGINYMELEKELALLELEKDAETNDGFKALLTKARRALSLIQ